MRKPKQPEPEMINLENHLTIEDWRFRVNFTESDVRRLSEGIVPEWFQQDCIFWVRTNPKPSDVMPVALPPDPQASEG